MAGASKSLTTVSKLILLLILFISIQSWHSSDEMVWHRRQLQHNRNGFIGSKPRRFVQFLQSSFHLEDRFAFSQSIGKIFFGFVFTVFFHIFCFKLLIR